MVMGKKCRFHNDIPHLLECVLYNSPIKIDQSRKEKLSLQQLSLCHGLVGRDQA